MSRQASRTPVRFPAGVNNSLAGANPAALLSGYGALDPTRYIATFNDHFTYAAGDYTITQTGGTAALADGAGGWLALTASTGGTDSIYMQNAKKSFYPDTVSRLWYEVRLKMDAVSTGTFVCGLIVTDTTPASNTDGIYFQKATAGTGAIDFVVNGSSTATTASAITTMTADTFIRLGFHYNPRGSELTYYVNGVQAGSTVTTNYPTSAGLTLTKGVAATSAVARTLTFDYEFAAQERWTPNATPDGR